MISDYIKDINFTDLLIPSDKEINNVIDKLNNGKKLDILDAITLDKLKICKMIIDSHGKNIRI